MSYEDSVAAEKKIYDACIDVHGLPPIFHYWTNKYLLPKLQAFGFTSPNDLFAKHLENACEATRRPQRFVSLGSGNCDLEIELALHLSSAGHRFILDCLDLNPTMLERGRLAAENAGLGSHLNFVPGDLNTWIAAHEYDAAIASQSLHHVVNLEGLFDQVKRSLRSGGSFLISDMIGRNGHQRGPEALEVIHQFWRKLPPSYRFNQLVGYYEELYQSWDCSVEGFEGVRSQDILPLLLERFHFHLFLSYGNIIDPFIDRAFGHHFDPASPWDRSFIDAVHRRDEEELASGRLEPTHMIAVVANEPSPQPRSSGPILRQAPIMPQAALKSSPPYEWHSWPHDPGKELEIACHRLADTGNQIRNRTAWALDLKKQLEYQTIRALTLEEDVESRTVWARRMERELENRTAWALRLQSDVKESKALTGVLQQKVAQLEEQVEERSAWALQLDIQLADRTLKANRLEAELHQLIHNPFHLASRLLAGIRSRFF